MRIDLFDEMYRIEKEYWWYKAKRNYVHRLLKTFSTSSRKRSFLDIGCGTGVLLQELKEKGDTYGFDISQDAVSYCKKRGIKNMQKGNIENDKPFPGKKFDYIFALDVVEHIEDDYKFAKTVSNSLKIGGYLVLTTSAYPWLWSYWDEIAGHARRYTKNRLTEVIAKSGLKIRYIRYTNMSVLPGALLFRFIKGSVKQKEIEEIPSDFIKVPAFINKLLVWFLGVEAFVATHIPLPFGLSFMVVAEKI
jgi:SAM-dependent methyltransferase